MNIQFLRRTIVSVFIAGLFGMLNISSVFAHHDLFSFGFLDVILIEDFNGNLINYSVCVAAHPFDGAEISVKDPSGYTILDQLNGIDCKDYGSYPPPTGDYEINAVTYTRSESLIIIVGIDDIPVATSVILSPVEGDIFTGGELTLSWQALATADSYMVELFNHPTGEVVETIFLPNTATSTSVELFFNPAHPEPLEAYSFFLFAFDDKWLPMPTVEDPEAQVLLRKTGIRTVNFPVMDISVTFERLLEFYDYAYSNALFVAANPAAGGEQQVELLRTRILAASEFYEASQNDSACMQLNIVQSLMDSQPQPPDFIVQQDGESVMNLMWTMDRLREAMKC